MSEPPGSVTLRYRGRLHHIGIGRTHAEPGSCSSSKTSDIRVNAATGELLRELILDPSRDYQPTGAPKGPKEKEPQMTTDPCYCRGQLSPMS